MEEKTRKKRHTYTEEFKRDTIKRLNESGLNLGAFCTKNDLNPGTVQSWKKQYNGTESNDVPTAEVQTENLPVKKSSSGNRYDIIFINDFLDEYEKLGPEVTIKAFSKSKGVVHSTAYKWVQRRAAGQENYQSATSNALKSEEPTILDVLNELQELKLINKKLVERLIELDPQPNPNVIPIDFSDDLNVLEELDAVCKLKRRSKQQQILYMITSHKDMETHG